MGQKFVVGMFSSGRGHPLGVYYGPASQPSPDASVDEAPDAPAFGSPFEFHKAKLKEAFVDESQWLL